MPEPLFTLTTPCRHAMEIRKSRFLAQATHVDNPDTAMDFVRASSDQGASHNCWAWRIGPEYRFNDDGEPASSAGKPILAAIDGQGLDAVIVVVTRWFGGIKLGIGGLVRAYGGCAAECLRQAVREPLVARARVAVNCDFALLALLKSRLPAFEATIEGERFAADGAELDLDLPEQQLAAFELQLADLSRGRSRLRRLG